MRTKSQKNHLSAHEDSAKTDEEVRRFNDRAKRRFSVRLWFYLWQLR